MADSQRCLRQDIHRHIQQQTRCFRPSPALLSLVLLAAQPLYAQSPQPTDTQATHTGWDCQPSSDASTWHCKETQQPGPDYRRPPHNLKSQQSEATPVATKLDWVPAAQLSATQQAQLATNCCGAYIEPQRTDAEATLAPTDAPVRASADKVTVLQQTTTVLEGKVLLLQGQRDLKADRATIDESTQIASLEGNIELRQPGVLMTGTKAQMHMSEDKASIEHAEFVMHSTHIRGSGSHLERINNNLLVLEDGSFTRCEPDSDAWLLQGSQIVIDNNREIGSGKHVRLEIEGVPVFYAPYLEFPLGKARKSGLLFPYLSSSDSGGGGLNFGIPYYFNLAPNYDLTLTPSHADDRGEMLELEFRHLSHYFETNVNMAFLGNDDGGDDKDDERLIREGIITEAQAQEFMGEDRWLFNMDQTGGTGERWNTYIDLTQVSDIDYFRDLDTASLSVNATTHLKRLGQYGYHTNNWLFSARAEEYQTLFTAQNILKPYRITPSLSAIGEYRLGNWLFSLDNDITRFDHPDANVSNPVERWLTGDRVHVDYRLTWDKQWLWGFFKPTVGVKHLSYALDDNVATPLDDTSPDVSVAQGSLDMGLVFERDGSWFGNSYLQTFEPQVFYFYSDFEDQSALAPVDFDTAEPTFGYTQLFRNSRFTGADRIDDANQVTLGVTSRLISADSGIEHLSISLGQIYYFQDRRIALAGQPSTATKSEVAARITAQISDHWRLSSDLIYNEEQQNITQGNISVHYIDDKYRLLNLAHRYHRQAGRADVNDIDNDGDTHEILENDIDQLDASLVWPVYRGWSLMARYHKDLTQKRELEKIAGLEYNNCCYRVRVMWRRWIDNDLINVVDDALLQFDEGVFIEVKFKGLGGTGTTISDVLSEGIRGYDRREANVR